MKWYKARYQLVHAATSTAAGFKEARIEKSDVTAAICQDDTGLYASESYI